MNIDLNKEFDIWENEREKHNEYDLQLKYFKIIKNNVPKIVNFWESLSADKKELLKSLPINFYLYKAWEEGFIEDVYKFSELNEIYHKREEEGENYSNPYFEISKELLEPYNIEENTLHRWDEDRFGLNRFFDANKKYYSVLIEDSQLKEILDLIEQSLDVNSNKSSQGCNKKAINKGNGLFKIFEMFVLIYNNDLENFENIVNEVPYLNKIAKEVFGFYNLDKGGFIFNSKITDFIHLLYGKKKIHNPSDIKSEFKELEMKYLQRFQDKLFIDKITDSLSNLDLEEEQIKYIQTYIQIDQFIYNWGKRNKSKFLGSPFSEIFEDKEQANNFFDYAREKLKILGIYSKESKKFTVTIPKKGNRNLLRIIYGPWVILDFEKTNENRFYRIALKIKDELSNFKKSDDSFKISINDDKYCLYEVSIENIEDIDHLVEESFAEIGNKFQNYTKTPYANKGYQKLKDAIFDEKSRNKILKKNFKLNETKDIDEPIDFENQTTNADNSDSSDVNYFWVTINPKIWTFDKLEEDKTVFYSSTNSKGNKRRIYSAYQEAKENDKVIFYESTPVKKIVAEGKVIKELHKDFDKESQEYKDGIRIQFTRNIEPISWKSLVEIDDLKNSVPISNGAQGSLFKLTKEEYETILALEELDEVSEENTTSQIWKSIKESLSFEKLNFKFNDKLYFEKGEKEKIERMITQAIKQGKHIILIGPPGTGKSKLAKQICDFYTKGNYFMTTAISDWSTFDTIGGLHPKEQEEGLEFKQGIILNCFKRGNKEINNWLIIDEINRADIDKAFGSLFSALTGDDIDLSYKIGENQIKIIGSPKDEEVLADYKYFIHPDWRIISTMNSLDKASLYEMSYAFMRRFAFIPINVPEKIDWKLVKNYCDSWKIELGKDECELISKLWNVLSNRDIQIGPSIIADICKYVKSEDNLEEAIVLFILPQLEGKSEEDIENLLKELKEIDVSTNNLKKDFSTFLGFKLKNEQN